MFGTTSRCAIAFFGTLAAGLPLKADDVTERAILVLDASGSMWGQVDGTHKITIARDVIQGLVDDWNPHVELGVTAYGHREKGNCADIETLVPVGPVDGDEVMGAIGDLNPKGKTPLTDAVRQAAETLKYTEERATVLLVSDGKETCDADPCAAAAELEASGIDFTVHVVGFDLTAEEKTQLQCIADNTGGRFLSADNAPELHAAMEQTVQLVAEPEPAAGIALSAVLIEGGEPVRAHFAIYEGPKSLYDGKQPPIVNLTGERVTEAMPAGTYHVVVRYDKAKLTRDIEVTDGDMIEHVFALGAGDLKLAAVLTAAGEPIGANMRVWTPDADANGQRTLVASKSSKPERAVAFTLPAGDYLVEAIYGDAEVTGDVQVEAGEITDKVMVMNTGFLEAWGTRTEGGESMHAHIAVHKADAGLDRLKSHVTGGYSKDYKNARFALAAGRYRLIAKDGSGDEVTVEVDVKPGETIEVPIVIPAVQ
ncbi:MAG: vWA domain-containing protein [Pseudomonadota bacterium]